MRRAAGPAHSSCSQAAPRCAPFETCPRVLLPVALRATCLDHSAGAGRSFEQPADTTVGGGETTHAPLLSAIPAAFVTLLVQAALAFQKYRLNNGLILGATLAVVEWYEDTARSKGLPPSRVIVVLIATSAGALSPVLQQAACALATGLAHAITPS